MAKWSGIIGFRTEVEKEDQPGVWTEIITERKYYGDAIKIYRSLDNSAEINDSININNQISIISDPYARLNYYKMIYITYMGIRWKIRNVEVEYPRMLLTVGGLYNDEN